MQDGLNLLNKDVKTAFKGNKKLCGNGIIIESINTPDFDSRPARLPLRAGLSKAQIRQEKQRGQSSPESYPTVSKHPHSNPMSNQFV